MKKVLLALHLLLLASVQLFAQDTPLSMNGRLKLVGNQLSNECGSPVQLRGMSTHAIQSHSNCYTPQSLEILANDWKSDLIRLAVYTADIGESKGYINGNRTQWQNWIDDMVNEAEANGMYVIIDWHILSDGNPMTYATEAKEFFTLMSSKYKDKRHVIYEICNEPNGGTSWGTIKSYAEQVIPVIRANDPENIIIVGTPDWSSKVWDAANNPLTGANAYNTMYAFHFYAGSHFDYNYLRSALGQIPIFVTEWGTVAASGDGGYNEGSSDRWLSILGGDNEGGQLVSNANWAFVDKEESAAALKPNSCALEDWTNLTQSGNYIYNYLRRADNFQQCNSAADDDNDGVANGSDICPGTPANTFVDSQGCPALQGDADNDGIVDAEDQCPNTASGANVNVNGCEILDDFVSNVCMGFNNYQGYARTDFSEDSLANVDYWNRPSVGNPVYSATTSSGELVVEVTNADPDYATMGFSFGELYNFNGTDYDTTLLPLDISRHPVIEMDMIFQSSSYSDVNILLDIQLEDVNGAVVNANGVVVMRKTIPLNEWTHVIADFTNGSRESWVVAECDAVGEEAPCYFTTEFDFTKVNKVKMNVNPGAGETWSRDPFTGTWKIDNFSVGYDEDVVVACTQIRDDDGDGVKQEDDKCPHTPSNAQANSEGCAPFQLDDDGDGVVNPDDVCPNTPAGSEVNIRGCAAGEGDSDGDGVLDADDQCPNTPANETVNINGCSDAQANVDDDEDGVINNDDLCPNTPTGETVDGQGCAESQKDDDNDGTPNGEDGCPNDGTKVEPGNCGCGTPETECEVDCAGQINGNAYYDNCGACVGGTTGLEACIGNPYNGEAQVIPGIIQSEYFDTDGANVSYYDTEATNQGGAFRTSEGVDIELISGSNYNIGYTEQGEWLEYTVQVLYTGTYKIHYNIASEGGNGTWHLTINGNNLAGSEMNAVSTGGWTSYNVLSSAEPVMLQSGYHTLRFLIDGSGFNIDYIEFEEVSITGMDSKLNSNVKLYPVPANETLTIDQTIKEFDQVVIMNLAGVVLKTQTLNSNKENIEIDDLNSGMYLIKLNGKDNSELFRVMIK